MRPSIPLLALALAACSAAEEPPPASRAVSFGGAAGGYEWGVANGAKGGLLLSATEDGVGKPVLVITCDNERIGGLQARVFRPEPVPAELELTAGETVMRVTARRRLVGNQAVVDGEGVLPEGWAAALGATRSLKVRYGYQGIEVQGPGREKADMFGRHCRDLQARAG